MDELGDEAADEGGGVVAGDGFAGGRDVEDAAVGGEDVQEVLELLDDALGPVAALGELGEGAAVRRGGHAEPRGQGARTRAGHGRLLLLRLRGGRAIAARCRAHALVLRLGRVLGRKGTRVRRILPIRHVHRHGDGDVHVQPVHHPRRRTTLIQHATHFRGQPPRYRSAIVARASGQGRRILPRGHQCSPFA